MEQTLTPIEGAAGAADATPSAASALASLRALGPVRLAVLAAVAVGLLGFFALLLLRVVEPEYTLLYAGLELEDSAQIVSRLEAMAVPVRLQDDGAAILVPADRALRLRMALAEDGLPRGGTVGDEIFDDGSPLGTTSALTDINRRRALEGELARTIASLGDVRSARVHLVLPKRELFRRTAIEPSASVTLRMASGRRLSRRQVVAVEHLVAAAVPALSPERIAIVDDQGTLLARGGDDDPAGGLPSQAEELRQAYETQLETTIEQLLGRSLGPGRVEAEVHAEMNFDQISTTEEIYDPDGRVLRSSQAVEEETQQAERDTDDSVSVGNNLPNAGADTPQANRTSNENTTRSEETVNYEISRKVRNHTQVGGRIERLSVAVLVDGRMTTDQTGQRVYQPLDASELAQLESLVRSAIGFDEARGDLVEIKNMPFSEPPPVETAEGALIDLDKRDLMRLAEVAALALVGLLLILLVVRPTLDRLLPPPSLAIAGAGAASLDAAGERTALARSEGPRALAAPSETPIATVAEDGAGAAAAEEETTDVAHVEGRVRSHLIQRARSVIDQAPEDAVAVLRAWLQDT